MSIGAQLVAAAERRSPSSVELGLCLSLVSRVSLPLLREFRTRLLPRASPGVEAELWHSPLVDIRGARDFLFHPQAAASLRQRLFQDVDRLTAVKQLVKKTRKARPFLVRLEEDLIWLAMKAKPGSQEDRDLESKLRSIHKALVEQGRLGLGRWVLSALRRIPELDQHRAGRLLFAESQIQLFDGRITLDAGGASVQQLDPAERRRLVRDLERIQVGVCFSDRQLQIREPPQVGDEVVTVPETRPRSLIARWGDPLSQENWLSWTAAGRYSKILSDVDAPVRLETLAGDRHELLSRENVIRRIEPQMRPYLVRFGDPEKPLGVGCLVTEKHVLTSACSLSAEIQYGDASDDRVLPVRFVFSQEQPMLRARIAARSRWPEEWRGTDDDGMVLLELQDSPSMEIRPAKRRRNPVGVGACVSYGFRWSDRKELWGRFRVGKGSSSRVGLTVEASARWGKADLEAWCGSPLIVQDTGEVVGVVAVVGGQLYGLDWPRLAEAFPVLVVEKKRRTIPFAHVSIARLPATGETFVGREDELAQLDAAWEDGTNVFSLVAMGGAGKSALVNAWLDGMQQDDWRGAERVFGWSFYSQGAEGTGASSEAFTEYALDWLGYDGEAIISPWKKGEVIARLLREQRTLLVLDGLEPLQHAPGAQTGRIKDPAVQALVKELAAKNPGLCVISTRLAVADVAGRADTVAVDLDELPPEAGAELLRRLDVVGPREELRMATTEFGGNSLALTLLGTYLRDLYGGDIRRKAEVPLVDEELEQGGHARRVMQSYEAWLAGESLSSDSPELKVLRLMGLFDRPAVPDAVEALRRPPIPELTDGFDDKSWRKALARLRNARLLAREDGTGSLDAHPLVREYFGERLREEQPEAWRAGNERLYEFYTQATDDLPDTLEGLLPLYAAVVHGCRAGRVQEAIEEIYRRRILRGNKYFSWFKLGAFGAELTILAAVFERPWARPDSRLTPTDQAWFLNAAGFILRALGRLLEAVEPMRSALERYVQEENWPFSAATAGNLSELMLTLGEVAQAVETSEECVSLAERSDDAGLRITSRATLAYALLHAGRQEESAAAFREAANMQAKIEPRYPRLYSLGDYQYCDLLLEGTEPEGAFGSDEALTQYRKKYQEVHDQTVVRLEPIPRTNIDVLDVALDYLCLGRADLGLALTLGKDFGYAAKHLDRAVEGLRESGHEWVVPLGLLKRAASHHLSPTPDLDAASSDLQEAQEIAERGHMRLHEADVHLEWTRLRLQTGDIEDARRHFERARELVTECGYGRREREVRWLQGRLADPVEPR